MNILHLARIRVSLARVILALLLIVGAATFALKGPALMPAYALDINQNQTIPARQFTSQQVSYYRVTVNFNDPRISTAQKFGRLFKNTFITGIACHVTTAFNAATTNVLTMGTTLASANEIIDAATSTKSIDESSATYQAVTQAGSLGVSVTSGADVDLYVKFTQTGAAATAGKATCTLAFIPDNDM
jgi:hypothetical protein